MRQRTPAVQRIEHTAGFWIWSVRVRSSPRLSAGSCLVRGALMEARPAGLSTRQLVSATEMSAYQAQPGLRFLREVLAA